VKPVLQALIIADHLYRDGASGKWVISGTFNRIFRREQEQKPVVLESLEGAQKIDARGFIRAGSPHVFISLTDVEGETPLELRYVDLGDDFKAIMEVEFVVTSQDRLATVEIGMPIPPLPIPHAGVYALELLSAGEPLGSLRITAEVTTGD
jgi:hypothetical protein